MSFNTDSTNRSLQHNSNPVVGYTSAQLLPSQITHLNADVLAQAAQLRHNEAELRHHAMMQEMQETQARTAIMASQMPPMPPNTYPGYNFMPTQQHAPNFYTNQQYSPVTGAPYMTPCNYTPHSFGVPSGAPMMMGGVGF